MPRRIMSNQSKAGAGHPQHPRPARPWALALVLATCSVASAQVPRTPVDAAFRAASETAAPGCELHGTKVSWAPNLEAAQQMAREQAKLVFVMHLSGDFTNPTFT